MEINLRRPSCLRPSIVRTRNRGLQAEGAISVCMSASFLLHQLRPRPGADDELLAGRACVLPRAMHAVFRRPHRAPGKWPVNGARFLRQAERPLQAGKTLGQQRALRHHHAFHHHFAGDGMRVARSFAADLRRPTGPSRPFPEMKPRIWFVVVPPISPTPRNTSAIGAFWRSTFLVPGQPVKPSDTFLGRESSLPPGIGSPAFRLGQGRSSRPIPRWRGLGRLFLGRWFSSP